ncbi:MAG: hypothetical protein PF489_08515 [Salinivirgaceae bacterium]|jgi:outer membrane biosynthesis protein TonB|nr:hypothetical protein [Salinivirgaceae bacterium]
MKNVSILIRAAIAVLFIGLSSTTVSASGLTEGKRANLADVKQMIDKEIQFPKAAREAGVTGKVKAQLTITNEGKLNVEAINGNPALTKYVQKQLNNVVVSNYLLSGKTFIANFDFRN